MFEYTPQLVNNSEQLKFLVDPNFKFPIIPGLAIYKLRKPTDPALGTGVNNILIPSALIKEIRILTLNPRDITEISLKGYEIYRGKATLEQESVMEDLTVEARSLLRKILLELKGNVNNTVSTASPTPFLLQPIKPILPGEATH